jgi:hypothetical protein
MRKSAVFFALSIAALVVQWTGRSLLADTPLPPPKTEEVWSPNKQFCAVMDPKPYTTTVFRVAGDGTREKQWAMLGWFRVAHLADDGEHFVVGNGGMNLLPVNVTKDEPMISFVKKGELVRMVTLGELLRNMSSLQRTVSHYRWGDYLGFDKKGRYVVKTVEGNRLTFDVTTGKRVTTQSAKSSPNDARLTEDEVVGIAKAKAAKDGIQLSEYNMDGCHYEFTSKGKTWTVSFVKKPPTPPGGHFRIVVDDRTKTATLQPGE